MVGSAATTYSIYSALGFGARIGETKKISDFSNTSVQEMEIQVLVRY